MAKVLRRAAEIGSRVLRFWPLLIVWAVLRTGCADRNAAKLKQEGVALDSTAAQRKRELKRTRQDTDGTFVRHPRTVPTDTAKAVVKAERDACDSVIVADSLRVQNQKSQVAALQPPRLKLFGELEYALPDRNPLLQGALSARVGVSLKIDPTLQLYILRQQPLIGKQSPPEWRVGAHKELRIL